MNQDELLRVPPNSTESEAAILGALLLDNESWERIGDVISAKDFYKGAHRKLYEVIEVLIASGQTADLVTVSEALKADQRLDEVGGPGYVAELAQSSIGSVNLRKYAQIVREKALLRSLLRVCSEVMETAWSPSSESSVALEEAERKIFELRQRRTERKSVTFKQLLANVFNSIDDRFHNKGEITGLATGFAKVDAMTAGLQRGDLVIVAGRPSMGKAQSLDSLIKTTGGWVEMGALQVGDAIASVDGRASIVTGVYPQGVRKVYRITFSDGRNAEACSEHLWSVRYRGWDVPRTLSTAQLQEMLSRRRYQHRLWVDQATGDFGHSDPLPVDPWALGALLGDAHMDRSFIFSTAEPEMVEHMAEAVGGGLELRHNGAYDWRIVKRCARRGGAEQNPLFEAIHSLGLRGVLSQDKFIPRMYLDANRPSRLALLQGLLDTDGWVEKWGSVRFCTTSYRLAKDVVELVRSLGGWCSLSDKRASYKYLGTRREGRTAYVLNIHHHEPASLFRLSTKRSLTRERQRIFRPVIVSITESRRVPTQCIAVSHPSRLYITNDYVVTHNTSFAMNVAEHVAIEKRLPVAVFSIEMTDVQLVQRMLGSVGRIDQHRLRTGMLTDEDWRKTSEAMSRLHDCPFVIEETVQLTITELRARARRIAKDNPGLALIIIDYLQLMASSAKTQSERTQEIGDISRGLKALAKELDIPIMALSQLNRAVEQRINKRPMSSDLRDSGSIEQDADVIVFLYRDDIYHQESDAAGYAEAIIGKQRNGATGTVYLRFVKEETRFETSDWKPPIKQRKKKAGFQAQPELQQRADIDG